MKTNFVVILWMLLLVACVRQSETQTPPNSAIVLSGQERGNGTDYVGLEGNTAWFSGKGKTFSYCVTVTPGFGVSEDDAKGTISEAIQIWSDYARERAPISQVVFDGRYENQCSLTTDLKFVLGGPDINGQTLGVQHVGTAIRQSHDPITQWSRGTIWIASQGTVLLDEKDATYLSSFPDWSEKNLLRTILLHELGHVFGVGHVELTVMDPSLSNILAYKYGGLPNSDYRHKFLEGIDGFQQLLPSDKHDGALGIPNEPRFARACAGNEIDNFKMLTGLVPQGPVRAVFETAGYKDYFLTITDSRRSFAFALKDSSTDLPGVSHSTSAHPVFNVKGINGQWRGSRTRTLVLETIGGERLYLSYLENSLSSFGVIDSSFQEFTATGQTLILNTASGPRYLFTSSIFLSARGGDGMQPRDLIRSCP